MARTRAPRAPAAAAAPAAAPAAPAAASILEPVKASAARLGNEVSGLGQNAKNAFAALGGAGSSAAGGAGTMALLPVRGVMNVVRWPVKMISGFYLHMPKTAAGATILGGIALVASLFRTRAEKRTQHALMEQFAAANQPVYAPQQVSYMNSVPPELSAQLAANQKTGGHEARVTAPTTESAKAASL